MKKENLNEKDLNGQNLNDEESSEEQFQMFNKKNMKKQASFYATALLLTTSVGALAGCADEETQDIDCEVNIEADACVDEDIYVVEDDNDYHGGGGYFFFYGGVYSDNSGKYHGGSGKYSHNYSKSVGKTKYSSVRAGSTPKVSS